MAQVQIPVNVLDERCIECKCMDLTKNDYYADFDKVFVEYTCSHLNLCRFIRNRIVRNEERSGKEEKNERTENN